MELQAALTREWVTSAERRAILQAEVSRRLAEAGTEYEGALNDAVRAAAELTGDSWMLRLFDTPTGLTAGVAIHDPDPVIQAKLRARLPTQPGELPSGLSALVLRDGVALRFGPYNIADAIALCPDRENVLRDVGASAVVTVPLTGRSGPFGTLSVIRHRGTEGLSADDDAFIDDMAHQIAATLDIAILLERANLEVSERERVESALAYQRAVLERLARGEPIAETLRELCLEIERQVPDALCSVLLHDAAQGVLRFVAGPSLPDDYTHAIDGLPVGPDSACCGTAAHRRTTVIVADVFTDPLTAPYVDLAREHNLRAVWSHPVLDQAGEVLGTFAVYHAVPHVPGPAELELVESTAALVGLALERQRAEQALAYAAQHDPLTGLPNRLVFLDRVAQAQRRARRAGTQVAVLFFDLDRFKLVNDSLGHVLGDCLLVEAAARLTAALGGATVARFGGDEFTVLFEDVHSPADVEMRAEQLGRVLAAEPFTVGGGEFFLSASVGIALGDPGADPESLVRDADAAMYRAKAKGTARFEVFDAGMREETVARVQLEADLRRGIERGELVTYYQPIVDLRDGRIDSVEALVRWRHPERGLLLPAEFLPVAEETGLIVTLGEAVLDTAVAQLAAWVPRDMPAVRMTVNLSPRQLIDPAAAQAVTKALDRHGVDPTRLAIELTETAIMEDVDAAATVVHRMAELGVRVLIDDFGTGYSSIAHLRRLPVSGIKIDRQFISDTPTDDRTGKLVGALVELAHALDLDVTAEGVDDRHTEAFLRDLGCEFAQGFLFSPPLPADEMTQFLLAPPAQRDR